MNRIVAIAALLLAASNTAGNGVRLEYEREAGAERCPAQDEFESLVAARLGKSPWSSTADRVVRVVFTPDRSAMTGRMELLDGGAVLGVREVQSPSGDCREVAESLALAVGVALEPATRRKPR